MTGTDLALKSAFGRLLSVVKGCTGTKLTVGFAQFQIEQAGLSPNRSTNLTR